MSQIASDTIKRLKDFIDSYVELISRILKNAPEIKDLSNLKAFIEYLFLQRQCQNSNAISILLDLYENEKYIMIPISILLRTSLSDFMTYYYFMKIVKDNLPDEDKINMEIKKYLVSNLHHLKKAKLHELGQSDFIAFWNDIKERYPNFIDKNTNDLIDKKEPSCNKIFDILKEDPILNWTSDAYEFYDYYSKYEHIGILTYDIQEVHKISEVPDIKNMILAVALIGESIICIIKSMPIKSEYESDLKLLDDLANSL